MAQNAKASGMALSSSSLSILLLPIAALTPRTSTKEKNTTGLKAMPPRRGTAEW
ncbi:secreted protein [gut metagenome]|uniref:Secreted protein n=1 Tax=gut metagenome TaxID=749906 RepID=J9CA24_9ZZZZ